MVLLPIIPYISVSWPPKLAELLLDIPVLDPVESYVDLFSVLGNDFIIDEAVLCFFVRLDGRSWFLMAYLFECLARGDCCFGIKK